MPTVAKVLLFLIEKGPGRTELELAYAIYGDGGTQAHVNKIIRTLEGREQIERRGMGGARDPLKCYIVKGA